MNRADDGGGGGDGGKMDRGAIADGDAGLCEPSPVASTENKPEKTLNMPISRPVSVDTPASAGKCCAKILELRFNAFFENAH